MGYKVRPTQFIKYKALKLVLPERANALGIEAEAPVFVSPYINGRGLCHMCHTQYCPLLYQVGHNTVAHHFCKQHGGGIYVRLATDHSGKWIYTNDLWDAIVHPNGPIRMGDDHGYQFHDVTVHRMIEPACHFCKHPSAGGKLLLNGTTSLVPLCPDCSQLPPPYNAAHHNHPGIECDWTWHFDGTEVRFSRPLPTLQEFLAQTGRHRSES